MFPRLVHLLTQGLLSLVGELHVGTVLKGDVETDPEIVPVHGCQFVHGLFHDQASTSVVHVKLLLLLLMLLLDVCHVRLSVLSVAYIQSLLLQTSRVLVLDAAHVLTRCKDKTVHAVGREGLQHQGTAQLCDLVKERVEDVDRVAVERG